MLSILERCGRWLAAIKGRPSASDRRRSQRTPLRRSLEVAGSQGYLYRASARDQSAEGLGAIVCGELAIRENVLLKLGQRSIRAAVRNRHGSRYGFEFTR
jgi:hypothetical protein